MFCSFLQLAAFCSTVFEPDLKENRTFIRYIQMHIFFTIGMLLYIRLFIFCNKLNIKKVLEA